MSDLDKFGRWMGGATGPFFDPKKRYGNPIHIKHYIHEFLKNLDNMEEFLMTEAYESILDDKHFHLYPHNEMEELAVRDLIEYFTELEEYEKCAKIVKYLEDGKNHKLSTKN